MARTAKQEEEKDVIDLELETKEDNTEMLKQLMEKINSMQKELDSSKQEKSSMQELIETLKETSGKSDSVSEENISVVSHYTGKLTLYTLGSGNGNKYVFYKFGDTLDIPYNDLKDIVRNNKRFAENAKFYILDKDVVKKLRLTQFYKNVLSNEQIMTLLEQDTDKVVELYGSTTEEQQKTILDMISYKREIGERVDANLLLALSGISGEDLLGNK